MAYTTYDFYVNTYFGDVVSESLFPKYLARATDKLNALTFNQINTDTGTLYATQISKATCALMDVMRKIDMASENALSTESGNVKSMSSGGRSVTFGDNSTVYTNAMASTAKQQALMENAIGDYLADTGLMYAGYYYEPV